MDNQVDKYSFITIIKEGLNTHQMMIPPDFVKYWDEDFSTNAILIGPSGDQRQVTIFEKDDIYMQNGGPRFLRNNFVLENELLLFTYEGESCFRVQIFGMNGCERLNTKIAGQSEASRHIFRCASASQMSSAAKEYPSFFTVFIPKFCSERLPIPNDFLKLASFEERVPKEFILRNYSEVGWNVRARRIGDNICFVDGWKQFVADNCLEGEDFIFFKYDGKDGMNFKILKLYGWEQIGAKDEGINAIKNDFILDMDEKKSTKDEEEDRVLEEQDDDSGEHIGGSHHRAGKAPVGKRKTTRSSASENCANAKNYVHPDNPHFTATLHKCRDNELISLLLSDFHVSKTVIDDFSLNLPQKITILCCEHDGRNDVLDRQLTLPEEIHILKNNRTVTGELRKWKDGQVYYKSWARFCRINNINMKKEECICEFVLGEDQQIQMLRYKSTLLRMVSRTHTAFTSEYGSMLEEVLAITEDIHDVHNMGKDAAAIHHSLMEDLSKVNAILLPLESVLSKDVAAND